MNDAVKSSVLERERGLWIRTLISRGFLKIHPKSPKKPHWITTESLAVLTEGVHYVTCPLCGKWFGELVPRHFRACHQFAPEASHTSALREAFPGVRFECDLAQEARKRDEAQREHQSRKIKALFQGEAGAARRERVRQQVLTRIASGGWAKNIAGLQAWCASPEGKAELSRKLRERWADPQKRLVHMRAFGLARAVSPRRPQPKTMTKPHLAVKAALASWGLPFASEVRVGPYRVDEACSALKVAVEVQGCFWHSCPTCGFKGPPRTQWVDKAKASFLTARGWELFYVWEHQTKSLEDLESALSGLKQKMEVLSGRVDQA